MLLFIKLNPIALRGNLFQHMKLKTKILSFVAAILFLAIMTVGLYSYFLAVNQVVDKVSETQLGLVRQVSGNIDFVIDDVKTISSLIVFEPSLQRDLRGRLSREIITDTQWARLLDRILTTKTYISMIAVYGDNGLSYSTASGYSSNKVVAFAEVKKNPIYRKALALNGDIGIEYFRNNPRLVQDNRVRRILMYRIIKDIGNYHNAGLLLIWLDEAKIRSIYQPNVPEEGSIFIVDAAGRVISDSIPANIEKSLAQTAYFQLLKRESGWSILQNPRRKELFTFCSSREIGWKVAALTPEAVLTKRINTLALVILSVGIISYVLLLYLSAFMTTIITNPIRQLLHSIKQVQKGDFSQQVDFSGRDEIGELGAGYNAMVAYIRDLIERVYKLRLQEREAELNALQAQINPHFLYNTLDTIFWKAQRSQAKEISEMVYALSRIFRLSLNRGNELTTVAAEKELIYYYLTLQQIRFKDRLTYKLDFEEGVLDAKIPKLVLQPFVENAIIHGIEALETEGSITISGRLEDGEMVFVIMDNGIGMNPEKIERIMSRHSPDAPTPAAVSGGYAIPNVVERLGLYYGNQYRLEFASESGMGTIVTITLPFNRVNK
jgi:two-component system sensor histidine kinase YesM